MAKRNNHPRDKIAEAALKLAAAKKWDDVTLAQIAKATKMPEAKLGTIVTSKEDVIAVVIERTDALMETAFTKHKPEGSPRERLFEVIMARFDVLQKNRKGVISIMSASRKNPASAAPVIPAMAHSIKCILQLADIEKSKSAYPLQFMGLGTIYSMALCTWVRDETRDISKTMATVDRLLTQAERVTVFIDTRK